MKIEVGKLKPNPFKKKINKGKLDKERIEKLEESIEHGTLPEIFTARKNDKGKYEISYGHHRQQAIVNKKGKDYKVEINLVDYDDETMLVDMVRENLTHRETDFQDEHGSVLLTKKYLKQNRPPSGQSKKSHKKEIGARDISKFLSKGGKTISKTKIADHLRMEQKLHRNILKSTEKQFGEHDFSKPTQKVSRALSRIDSKSEQVKLLKRIQDEEMNTEEVISAVTIYNKLSDKDKQKVLKGDVNFRNVDNLIEDKEAEEEIERQAQETAKEIVDSGVLEKYEETMKKHEATAKERKAIFELEMIKRALETVKVECPEHGKECELIWECGKTISDSIEKLRGEKDEKA